MIKKCVACGRLFIPSNSKSIWEIYCSKECKRKGGKKNEQFNNNNGDGVRDSGNVKSDR